MSKKSNYLSLAPSALVLWALLGEQGARVGPVTVPALSWWWVVGALALVLWLTPNDEEARLSARHFGFGVGLLLGFVLLVYWRGASLHPALDLDVVVDGERVVRAGSLQLPSRRDLRRLTGERRNVGVAANAVLDVPADGVYRFSLYCDDRCELGVGDHRFRGSGRMERPLELRAGPLPFELDFEQRGGPAALLFEWNGPSAVELLPIEYFLRAAFDPPRSRWSAHLSLVAMAIWWAALVGYLVRIAPARGTLLATRWAPATAAALVIVYGSLLRVDALLVHSGLARDTDRGAAMHERLSPLLPDYALFNPFAATDDPYRADVRSYLDRAETLTLGTFYAPSFREPFYVALVAAFVALFGSELGVLVQSFFFSCATLPLFFVIARKMHGGLWAIALLVPVALHEWLVLEAPTGYRMSAYAFFLLLATSVFAFRRGALTGALSSALLALIRLSALTVVLPLVALRLWPLARRERLGYLGRFSAVFALLVGPFLISNLVAHGDPFYPISFHTEFWLNAEGLAADEGPVSVTRYFTDFGRFGALVKGTALGLTVLPVRTFWTGLGHFPALGVVTLLLGLSGLVLALRGEHRVLPIAYLGHLLPFAYVQNFPSGEMPRFVMPAFFLLVLALPVGGRSVLTLGRHLANLRFMKMSRFVALTVFLGLATGVAADDRMDRLPKKYKDWIEKEVVYIIADKEREAFLDLESEEEWEAFIRAFWIRRDPDPVTPVNEFKEEHYRRIEFANEYLGREASVPGWMTDRGKMYIILGEPDDREDFTSVPMLYPTEVWFYHQNKEKSLPPLYLLFWQEHQAGAYKLFNHFFDDPEDLMPAQALSTENSRLAAYQMLQEMSPDLAHASITMRADRSAYAGVMQPDAIMLDVQTLLSDIYISPHRRVDTRYVDEGLEHKGLVETDYLFNYVPNTGMANVMPGPGGTSFVHYAVEIEPQHMTLAHDPDENVYYTSFELRAEVTTPEDNEIVYSFTKEPFIRLTPTQFQDVGYRAFSYRDMFPLIEGSYLFRLVLKNRARSEYTIFEQDLVVPERPASEPYLGAPVLLYGMGRIESSDEAPAEPAYRTYRLGNVTLDPNAKRAIAIGNYLMAHIPLENVPDETELHLRVVARDEATEAVDVEETHRLDFYERPVVVRVPLEDVPGGRYRLVVELRDRSGATMRSQSADFDVSPRAQIHRPWAVRDTIQGEKLGLVRAALAEQALRLGQTEKGRALAEAAVAEDPNAVAARLMLARFHLDEGGFEPAIRLLEPARAQAPRNVEILLALGDAHLQVGHYQRASELFQTASEIRRPDAALLNALAVCQSQLGNTDQAISYLERSLELDPNQDKVKSLLAELRTPNPTP